MKFFINIKDHKLQNPILKDYIQTLPDGDYEFEVNRPKRGNNQNAYYWAVPVPMIVEALRDKGYDYDPVDVHEFLKLKFNPKIIIVDKDEQRVGGSTRKLREDEFEEYIKKIQQWASEILELYIPSRGEDI